MIYDLMESDQTGVTVSRIIDFPEITMEMYEDGEDTEVLEKWLLVEDLNSFSTSYFFQNPRESDPSLVLDYQDMMVFYKFCVNRVTYDLFKDMMMGLYPGSEKYVEDKWPSFRNDPMGFIVGRGEKDMFSLIVGSINELNYKG